MDPAGWNDKVPVKRLPKAKCSANVKSRVQRPRDKEQRHRAQCLLLLPKGYVALRVSSNSSKLQVHISEMEIKKPFPTPRGSNNE